MATLIDLNLQDQRSWQVSAASRSLHLGEVPPGGRGTVRQDVVRRRGAVLRQLDYHCGELRGVSLSSSTDAHHYM